MSVFENIIEFVFGSALFVNALLFVPQAIRIFREKTAQGVSVLTFGGFLLIQLAVILHGVIHKDYILISGYLASMLTCGAVVFLTLMYRKNHKAINEIGFEEILEQLPGHVYWKDRDGVTLGCNRNNWYDFGAKSAADFIGKKDHELFIKDQADLVRKHDVEVISSGKATVCEEQWTDENGNTIVYLSHKAPLKNKNGDIVGTIGTSVDITESKRETLDKLKVLENIVAIMPGHLYWMNTEGVYLGCNDNYSNSIGFASRNEIVGKSNADIGGFLISEVLDPVNKKVMSTGETIVVEEPALLLNGTEVVFLSTKTPLYDYQDNIVGMVGISIDITDRKKVEGSEREAASLKLESELQRAKLEEYERSKKIAAQVVHDIRSPLASLLMLLKSTGKDIPEKTRITLRDIAINFLNKYRSDESDYNNVDGYDSTIVALSLTHVLGEKREQYKEMPVKFIMNDAGFDSFTFVGVGSTDFKRMISNLLDNAVEALTGEGVVDVKLESIDDAVKIIIEDNGKGMPLDVMRKLMEGVEVTSGKRHGHGLGFIQVRKVLVACNGRLEIDSELGKGTRIILTIPRSINPDWIAKEIVINKGDTIVVLDDDESIHGAWESRFQQYNNSINLEHFRLAKDAEVFINDFSDKSKVFLLTDFELLKQNTNGLDIVERLRLSRTVLVTSHYSNVLIRKLASNSGTKILPKALASEVSIVVK